MEPKLHVFGGGTFSYVSPHNALSAPAFGETARRVNSLLRDPREAGHPPRWFPDHAVILHLTRMADSGRGQITTNEDLARRVDQVLSDPLTRVVIFSVAAVDFHGNVVGPDGVLLPRGKDVPRLSTSGDPPRLQLGAEEKIIRRIRRERKDVFLVGFKTTAGWSRDDQYLAGLRLLKSASCNLVLANDIHTRHNMVITPEQAAYHETADRDEVLRGMLDMAHHRSSGTFTRSTVVPGDPVPWDGPEVHSALRTVVDHCISRGAYKPFLGKTVGHFAARVSPTRFLTSRRGVDFNKIRDFGLVDVESLTPDAVTARGFKPSVGGQSQRAIFADHPDTDFIFHAHVPLRPGSPVPVRPQRNVECGSHQCGENTSSGLKRFQLSSGSGDFVYAVMLDQHGPNVVFPKTADPSSVIAFIESNFDLSGRTDGVGLRAH
jgi:hypothetical protein